MLTDKQYDAIMEKAAREEDITFLDVIHALEYIELQGVDRYSDLTSKDWIANIQMLVCAIEE